MLLKTPPPPNELMNVFFLQVLIMLSLVAIQSLLFIMPTISGQVHHQSTGTSPATKV